MQKMTNRWIALLLALLLIATLPLAAIATDPEDPVEPPVEEPTSPPEETPTGQVVTLVANGGVFADGTTSQTITLPVDGTYAILFDAEHLPTDSNFNFKFYAWYTTPGIGGTRVLAEYDVTSAESRTLFARWVSTVHGGALNGWVRDAETKIGISGARVTVWDALSYPYREVYSVYTNPQGHFSIPNQNWHSAYVVIVEAIGYKFYGAYLGTPELSGNRMIIELERDPNPPNGNNDTRPPSDFLPPRCDCDPCTCEVSNCSCDPCDCDENGNGGDPGCTCDPCDCEDCDCDSCTCEEPGNGNGNGGEPGCTCDPCDCEDCDCDSCTCEEPGNGGDPGCTCDPCNCEGCDCDSCTCEEPGNGGDPGCTCDPCNCEGCDCDSCTCEEPRNGNGNGGDPGCTCDPCDCEGCDCDSCACEEPGNGNGNGGEPGCKCGADCKCDPENCLCNNIVCTCPRQPTYGLDPLTRHAFLIGACCGNILPRNPITRAETATIFFRLMSDAQRTQYWNQENDFPDVSLEQWFNNAVSTTTAAGLFEGKPDGIFAPLTPTTRAEFATVIVRMMDVSYEGPPLFSDIEGHWAEDAINAAAAEGWVVGMEDGTFQPDQPMTRAEAAAMINRKEGRVSPDEESKLPHMLRFPDNTNSDYWHFLYIKSATNSYQSITDGSAYDYGYVSGLYEFWIRLLPPGDWTVLEHPNSRPEDIR